MRLWHEALIPDLPRAQLLGQHRECCALRGNGWGKSHATVNYVFNHSPSRLYQYHVKVMEEMKKRGYKVYPLWENPLYRGKSCVPYNKGKFEKNKASQPIYPEHNEAYLQECLENLRKKGIKI